MLFFSNQLYAAPPKVITVPQVPFDFLIAHDTWAGEPTILKGIARDEDDNLTGGTYYWVFGDGEESAPAAINNPDNLSATHTYAVTPGTLIIARLYVTNTSDETSFDEYRILVQEKSLDVEINKAIDDGLWWLYIAKASTGTAYRWQNYYATGYTGYYANPTASAVQAFEINGHLETGDPDEDPYVNAVKGGLDYLLTILKTYSMTNQTYGNPDANNNGIGLSVDSTRPIYETGAVMDAFVASGTPEAIADTGGANVSGRRYQDIVQDMCDMYALGQLNSGGWQYGWNTGRSDNSASQWGAIGMIAAERNFGCTIPQWVKDRNIVWLGNSYNGTGFGYTSRGNGWATTPSGMVQMAFSGLDTNNSMWQTAQNWIDNSWASFITTGRNNRYYSYYAFAKAMRLAAPNEVTHLNSGFDWYGDETHGLARILVDRQSAGGSWPYDGWPYVGQRTAAAWNVIILTRTLFEKPPVAIINAAPNPGAVGQTITFDGSSSYHVDPAKQIATYLWDFDASDGVDFNNPDAIGPVTSHAYSVLTDYTVNLKVLDNSNPERFDTSSITVYVTIPPHPPTAVVGGPYIAATDETILVDGSGSYDIDEGEGDSITAWDWESDFIAPYDFNEGSGAHASLPAFDSPGHKDIALRVTDDTENTFPQANSPNRTDVDYGEVMIYQLGVADLAARPKDTKCQLTWTHNGALAYKILRSEQGPNVGFVQIGTTTSTYSTYLDYNLAQDVGIPVNSCKGDFTGDQNVDEDDQIIFSAAFNSIEGQSGYDARCDFDEDGDVDGSDAAFFSFELGRTDCSMVTGIDLDKEYWYRIMTELNDETLISVPVYVYSQGRIINLPPAITSVAVLVGQEGTQYEYDMEADDPENTVLTYLLDQAPAGMDIDPGTGMITWTPDADQVGLHDIMVRVQDADMVSATQYFQILVSPRPNTPPLPNPGGPYSSLTSETITFSGSASDPEGDPITAYLWSFGDGNSASGQMVTHQYNAAGTYTVTLYATDDRGATGSAEVACQIEAPNRPPIADAGGPYEGETDVAVNFDGSQSYDPDNDTLTYTWNFGDSTPAQTGIVVTHVYTSVGTYIVSLSVDDGRGGLDTAQATTIVTLPNEPPVANFSTQGDLLTWTILTFDGSGSSDPEGRPLTAWEWNFGDGVSTTGTIVSHGFADPGDYTVTLTVTDDKGVQNSVSQVLNIVHPPNNAPSIEAGGPYRGLMNTAITLTASGVDPNGDNLVYTWHYDGNDYPGQSIDLTFYIAGTYTVALSADDGYGGTAQDTAQVIVSDPAVSADTTPPEVSFSSPAAGTSLSGVVDITGSVADDNLQHWILEYAAVGSSDWMEISSGSTSVNQGVLGQLDVSLLPQDFYRFRLTADDNDFSTNKWIDCQVDNPLKLGRFKISYDDLSLPVMGMPLKLTRTYDSILKGKGDFGIGWTLDIKTMSIREDASHNVFATLPNGRRVAFAFTPVQLSPWFPLYEARFTAPPGIYDELDFAGERFVVFSGNNWYYFGSSAGIFNPSEYILKTKQGLTYTVDETQGVKRIEDRNNNWMNIADTGITTNSGRNVIFTRDGEGRITAIVDPAGTSMQYAYDSITGDLLNFTDQQGGVTAFTYDGQHNLLSITAPDGRMPLRTEYYADGRLQAHLDEDGNRTVYSYDIPGRLETVTQPSGHSIVYAYDAKGNVIQETDSEVGVTAYTYDATDNLVTRVDPSGRKIDFTYDSRGNKLTETRSPDGIRSLTRIFTYNNLNQYTSVTEPLGQKILYMYDADGNLTEKQIQNGPDVISTETWTIDGNGNPLTHVNALGQTTNNQYNSFGDLIQVINPVGISTQFEYDFLGRRIGITDGLGNKTSLSYDGLGNVISFVDPLGQMPYTIAYNSEGQAVSLRDMNGETRYGYTSLGWLDNITDATGNKWQLDHDTTGAVNSMTDSRGNLWQYGRDGLSRVVSRTDPLANIWRFDYDPDGYITQRIQPDGTPAGSQYNGMGKLILETRPEGIVTYAYDDNNRLTEISDTTGNTAYTYNDLGLPTSVTTPGIPNNRTIVYEYDTAGNRTKIICPEGKQILYGYDSAGRLASVGTGSDSISYTYDGAGRRMTATASNGVVTTFGYDGLGRMTSIIITKDAAILASYTYTFDQLGNRTGVIRNSGSSIAWGFDPLGRLAGENMTGVAYGSDQVFTYDAAGNRFTPGLPKVYRADNSLLQSGSTLYEYDLNGNLLSIDSTLRYTYDSRNRLVSHTDGSVITTYSYDSLGRRITKAQGGVTRQYLYDHQHILAEYLGNVLTANHIYSNQIDEPVMTLQDDSTYFYHADGLGNIVLITDNTGAIVQEYDYDAWGNLIRNSGIFSFSGPGLVNTFTYTGREYDVESELYHYRTRAYDPGLGRFLQKDGNQGDLMLPQTLNLYAYVMNNPVTYDDPSGQTALVSYVIVLCYPSGKEVAAALSGFLTGFSVTNIQFLGNYMSLIGNGYDVGMMWYEATNMTKDDIAIVKSSLGAVEYLSDKSKLKVLGGIPEAFKGGVTFKVGFKLTATYKNFSNTQTFEKEASGGGFLNGTTQAFSFLKQLTPF